ncbi:MAG: flotillin domain-containing protein [Nocardioides sp.]|uniref:flotillin domain-containing protein n=1 Tax=Nocardioides sp. TaxID=35761 RepID=UPI003EFC6B2D
MAEAQASVTEKQLEVDVRKPADAERYRIEQEAEAKRAASVSQAEGLRAATLAAAEADRRARELAADANAIEGAKQGEAERSRRAAIAEAVRLEGEAQAAAELAVGRAKAEAMTAAAEAFKQYGDAAVVEMLVKVLPEVARELAAPMANIDKLTVVSTDGASALPKAITNNLTQVTELVKGTTGIDLGDLVGQQISKAPAVDGTAPTGV